MSKRKREGDDKLEPDAVDKSEGEGALNTSSSLSAAKPGGQAELQTNGSHGTCSPGEESTPARVDLSKAADLASKAMSFTGGKDGPVKITICGEEVTLKGTAGRRKRKQPIETLILLAYKGRLAMACKNNNMVAALDLYREMKSKEIKQDPSVSPRDKLQFRSERDGKCEVFRRRRLLGYRKFQTRNLEGQSGNYT